VFASLAATCSGRLLAYGEIEGLGIGCRLTATGVRIRYCRGCTGFNPAKVLLDPAPGRSIGWKVPYDRAAASGTGAHTPAAA